jgi:hypothetical protein
MQTKCRKIQYETKQEAKKELRIIKKRPYFSPKRASVYLCRECGCWHLGHRKKYQLSAQINDKTC